MLTIRWRTSESETLLSFSVNIFLLSKPTSWAMHWASSSVERVQTIITFETQLPFLFHYLLAEIPLWHIFTYTHTSIRFILFYFPQHILIFLFFRLYGSRWHVCFCKMLHAKQSIHTVHYFCVCLDNLYQIQKLFIAWCCCYSCNTHNILIVLQHTKKRAIQQIFPLGKLSRALYWGCHCYLLLVLLVFCGCFSMRIYKSVPWKLFIHVVGTGSAVAVSVVSLVVVAVVVVVGISDSLPLLLPLC